jgi:hypothetical protein
VRLSALIVPHVSLVEQPGTSGVEECGGAEKSRRSTISRTSSRERAIVLASRGRQNFPDHKFGFFKFWLEIISESRPEVVLSAPRFRMVPYMLEVEA